MIWVSTEPSLRLASTSVFWMCRTWLACSRTSCLRVRSNAQIRRRRRRRHEAGADQAYLVGAICPSRGVGATIIMPTVNTETMSEHLKEISTQVAAGAHRI
jgi:hypothetical protein